MYFIYNNINKMQLTVKDLKQVTHVIDNLELTDSVESLCEKVQTLYNFTDGVRLIYCGRIVEKTKTLGDYFKQDNNSFIVCMPEKAKSIVNQPIQTAQSSQPTQSTQPTQPTQPSQTQHNTAQSNRTQTHEPQTNTDQQTHTYTTEQIRALMVVFMQFVRSSPDVFYIFCTNQRAFQELLLSDMFANMVITPMLAASTQIVNAINTNSDISIPVPVLTNNNRQQQNIFGNFNPFNQINQINQSNQINQINQVPNIINTASANIQTQTTQTSQSGQQNQPVQINQILNSLNQLNIEEDNQEAQEDASPINQINQIDQHIRQAEAQLTETDKNNINELTALGFSTEIATQTYIMCGKNKEVTASILFELM